MSRDSWAIIWRAATATGATALTLFDGWRVAAAHQMFDAATPDAGIWVPLEVACASACVLAAAIGRRPSSRTVRVLRVTNGALALAILAYLRWRANHELGGMLW